MQGSILVTIVLPWGQLVAAKDPPLQVALVPHTALQLQKSLMFVPHSP